MVSPLVFPCNLSWEAPLASNLEVLHLHTYFLFPIAIDQDAVMDEHPEIWRGSSSGLRSSTCWFPATWCLDMNRRPRSWADGIAAPSSVDLECAYLPGHDVFSPICTARVFRYRDANAEHEALTHRYVIHPPAGTRLCYEAEDDGGSAARVEVTDLRLLMFANGVGILTMGVEARELSYAQALWINEMMRKIYPSSSHQIQTGRIPNRLALALETGAERYTVAEERLEKRARVEVSSSALEHCAQPAVLRQLRPRGVRACA